MLTDDLLLVGTAADGLELDRSLPVAVFRDEALVLPTPADGLRRIVDAYGQRAGIPLRASVETDSLSAMTSLVQNGFGKTLLPLARAQIDAPYRVGETDLTEGNRGPAAVSGLRSKKLKHVRCRSLRSALKDSEGAACSSRSEFM